MGTGTAWSSSRCWPAPHICQAPTAEHRGDKNSSSQISASFLTSSRREDGSVFPELQLSFYSKGSQGQGAGRTILQARGLDSFNTRCPCSYFNCWRETTTTKRQKCATFPKNLWSISLALSASFSPAGTGLNSGAREKIGTLKRKQAFFLVWKNLKCWQKCLFYFLPYELKEKGFNFFPLANRYFKISCISQL